MEQNIIVANDTGIAGFIISPEALFDHWQGHRHLTRRMIEAFPEDKLFTFSIGGMRNFAGLAMEMIRLAALGMHGITTGNWTVTDDLRKYTETFTPASKKDILELWDEVTEQINTQ